MGGRCASHHAACYRQPFRTSDNGRESFVWHQLSTDREIALQKGILHKFSAKSAPTTRNYSVFLQKCDAISC